MSERDMGERSHSLNQQGKSLMERLLELRAHILKPKQGPPSHRTQQVLEVLISQGGHASLAELSEVFSDLDHPRKQASTHMSRLRDEMPEGLILENEVVYFVRLQNAHKPEEHSTP